MDDSVLMIKNMVCPRCIQAVKEMLDAQDISYSSISLGKVTLEKSLSHKSRQVLADALLTAGFELLDDPKATLVNNMKHLLIEKIVTQDGPMKVTYSTFLSEGLHKDFAYLSRLFSSVSGVTLERYILTLKTERVKELLIYDELTLSEIAYRLGYSSTAHLSAQFKKETGMTPSAFKSLKEPMRKSLDTL
jgi:AraC family transcriptional regulator